MANTLSLFRYFHRNSAVHRLHALCKLLCMLAFAVATLWVSVQQGRVGGLLFLSILQALLWFLSGLPCRLVVSHSRLLLFWLPILIIVPAFTLPGQTLGTSGLWQYLTIKGLYYGLDFSWKFTLLFTLSILFTTTTTATQISRALAQLLQPLPAKIPAIISTMIGLIFAQTPAIFAAYSQMTQAQTARLANSKGFSGWVKRFKQLMLPLLRLIFTRSDALVFAMEARCFNYHRTQLRTPISLPDIGATLLFCALCAASVWGHYHTYGGIKT